MRAHVFFCMLAYYVEWHMRQRLKPLLFDDEEPQKAQGARASVVAPAEVSPSAKDKAHSKRTASGERVHSSRTLLDDLATIAKNRVVAPVAGSEPFELITRPTAHQRAPSRCSAFAWNVPSSAPANFLIGPENQRIVSCISSKFSLVQAVRVEFGAFHSSYVQSSQECPSVDLGVPLGRQ